MYDRIANIVQYNTWMQTVLHSLHKQETKHYKCRKPTPQKMQEANQNHTNIITQVSISHNINQMVMKPKKVQKQHN